MSRHDEPAHDVLAAEAFEVPAPDPELRVEPAHDVLAAEEFGMPAADPALHVEPAHDVLAAEEFGMPAADPELNRSPAVPGDPSGRPDPHDILAADAFPMPAVLHHGPAAQRTASRRSLTRALIVLLALGAARRGIRSRR